MFTISIPYGCQDKDKLVVALHRCCSPSPYPTQWKIIMEHPPKSWIIHTSTGVPASGLLHSTDLSLCGSAALDLSAWTWLGLSSGSPHWHSRAKSWLSLFLFGGVPWIRCVGCLELHSLRDRKGSSRRGTESSVLQSQQLPGRKEWNKTMHFCPEVVF